MRINEHALSLACPTHYAWSHRKLTTIMARNHSLRKLRYSNRFAFRRKMKRNRRNKSIAFYFNDKHSVLDYDIIYTFK